MFRRLKAKFYARKNQIWYQIRKLGYLPLDNNCELCKGTWRNFKRRPLNEDEVIVIMPESNGIGGIRAFHIGRIERERLEGTKIYKDLED